MTNKKKILQIGTAMQATTIRFGDYVIVVE